MKNNFTLSSYSNRLRTRNKIKPLQPPGYGRQPEVPQLVMITSFPPRECGIATYAQDLMHALDEKFTQSFDIKICALENGFHQYTQEVSYVLETKETDSYQNLIEQIDSNDRIKLIVLQHEFGLFRGNEKDLLGMVNTISKPVIVVFHTVLPKPGQEMQQYVYDIANSASGIVVMTNDAKDILSNDYLVPVQKITVIPHGTHLVAHTDKEKLKEKYGYAGKKVLSTFGLLSSGKNIETTLRALPAIIKTHPEVLFLIIGKTHPAVVQQEGEKYREGLISIINTLGIEKHVAFVNEYLPLATLLEYLQLTDIYLFTSNDPNQAVSGTFSYAISCGCPVISTPIPHAIEVIQHGNGRIFGFGDYVQLAQEVTALLNDKKLRYNIRLNGLQQMAPTSWENSALKHAKLFEAIIGRGIRLSYKIPEINLSHLKKMTTDFGIIQFAVVNRPDLYSGYTLDDNARALIAFCKHHKIFRNEAHLPYIERYLDFILYCYQPEGYFANYISITGNITAQNKYCNLEDSSGRAIWALGYMLSLRDILPIKLISKAESLFEKTVPTVAQMHSTRAMAFCIKGIYYANLKKGSKRNLALIEKLADRMVRMYEHEADRNWQWFESYMTYANGVLPEAMLFAFMATKNTTYQSIALLTFDFLLSKIFTDGYMQVITNNGWLHNGQEINFDNKGGEQPIDVAYAVMALSEFYNAFKIEDYKHKMTMAFDWFLGKNHLNQITYNPCTGGCYDGLEKNHVNLNQGAESAISYLLARLTIEAHQHKDKKPIVFQVKRILQQQNNINT